MGRGMTGVGRMGEGTRVEVGGRAGVRAGMERGVGAGFIIRGMRATMAMMDGGDMGCAGPAHGRELGLDLGDD